MVRKLKVAGGIAGMLGAVVAGWVWYGTTHGGVEGTTGAEVRAMAMAKWPAGSDADGAKAWLEGRGFACGPEEYPQLESTAPATTCLQDGGQRMRVTVSARDGRVTDIAVSDVLGGNVADAATVAGLPRQGTVPTPAEIRLQAEFAAVMWPQPYGPKPIQRVQKTKAQAASATAATSEPM